MRRFSGAPALPSGEALKHLAGHAWRAAAATGALRRHPGWLALILALTAASVAIAWFAANAVAALNCRALGARGGMPTRDEVTQLLQTQPARARARF